ncbi:hypothetical protein [Streptomyces flaveus]|uniref:hypothetical protein n=1 Tax=Streptomyces flaveus TaxID=66370 RepID=UPI00332740FB
MTLAMLRNVPGRPEEDVLRRALRRWAFVVPGPEERELPVEDRLVLLGVPPLGEGGEASPPLIDLHDPILARDVLEALRRKIDGTEAAVETMRCKRKVLVHALYYARERGELGSHPLERTRWRVLKQLVAVDPRVVADPKQAYNLLNASPASAATGGPRSSADRVLRGHVLRGPAPGGGRRSGAARCRLPSTGCGRWSCTAPCRR